MYRITAIFLVAFMLGCQTGGDEGDRSIAAQSGGGSNAPMESYDIGYEVAHTHIDSSKNPIDVYSVKIYEDRNDLIQLSKYVSQSEEYYYLSLKYTGSRQLSVNGAVTIDIDGFISTYQDYDPYRSVSPDGTVIEMATVILNFFAVNDMTFAANLRIEYKFRPPITITPEGIENIERFISEMEGG